MSPAQRVGLVLAAAAGAVSLIAGFEGYRPVGYLDAGGVATDCFGHTGPEVKVGQVRTEQECMAELAQDAVKHGIAIDACLPPTTPSMSREAFTSTAYNIGAGNFCGSTAAKRLKAGDLAGACAALEMWVKVDGRVVQGLVNRRAKERAWCEQGLKEAA